MDKQRIKFNELYLIAYKNPETPDVYKYNLRCFIFPSSRSIISVTYAKMIDNCYHLFHERKETTFQKAETINIGEIDMNKAEEANKRLHDELIKLIENEPLLKRWKLNDLQL